MPVTTRVRSGISCFLFQLLKYFEGPLEVVGTFVIPTVGFILLLFLPFLDKKERAALWKRPVALTVTSLSVILIVLLTILGAIAPRLELAPEQTPAVEQIAPSEGENSGGEVGGGYGGF